MIKFLMDRVVRKFNISSLITFEDLKNFVVNENIAEPLDPVLCKDMDVLKLEYDTMNRLGRYAEGRRRSNGGMAHVMIPFV